MDTPSQLLAAKIIERLGPRGAHLGRCGKDSSAKLAEGKLRAEDWQLPIELAKKKEEKR